jgi:spermidine/putrescine transport system substrate-binding protein
MFPVLSENRHLVCVNGWTRLGVLADLSFSFDAASPSRRPRLDWGTHLLWIDNEHANDRALALPKIEARLLDPSGDKAIVDKALADVTELIDLVNVKVNIEGYKDIPEGTTTIAHTWSADLITGATSYMPDGVSTDVLGFWHPPSDRYLVANDSMGVLANAENPVLAHLYLNFLLDNDVAEKNFSWIGYLPALTKLDADYVIAQGYVPENLRNCVPTNDDISKGLVARPLGLDGDVLYEQAWSTFRTGA